MFQLNRHWSYLKDNSEGFAISSMKQNFSKAWYKVLFRYFIQNNLVFPNQFGLKPDEFYISQLVSVFPDICQSSDVEQGQPPEVFYKKNVLKNFTKFTGNQLCQSLFFNKIAGLRPTTLLKKRLMTGFFLWILRNYRTPPCDCFWW